MKTLATIVILIVVAILGVGAFVWSGLYNIGADAHHTKPVYALMQTLREHSIAHHAKDIAVPNLDDPQLILKGAGQYAAMCTGCHLAPGMAENEMRPGLYPKPPQLSKFAPDPREAFWVIKHGIKMSAMPAWGSSHDDATIWSMVAFLQKLPGLSPAQYKDIVARAPPDEDMDMDMGGDHAHAHDHPDATPPTDMEPPAVAAPSSSQ
jgi:mono/diheme cytochrome c family protein